MITLAANVGNKLTTFVAKLMTKTGCIVMCHNPEAPDELFK
jgi:hypothetical protein